MSENIRIDLSEIDPREFDAFEREMEDRVIPELMDKRRRERWAISGVGWYCGNCKNYHAPLVHTCPEPPAGGSLRERLKDASNG